jgi:processive 1,2-diacylglycerol beta-glucosyltransferase
MKNILVLSVSAGAGHVRAAEAICAWAPRAVPPIQAMHLDVMHFAPATFRKLYTDYYITLVT